MADRTKIWIADTMRKLMAKKPIDKIRVTEICREAEIERPTFYYHFNDKYDLMAWIFFQSAYNTDVLDLESAASALDQMKKDFIFYKRAYEDNSQTPMWQYMLEYFSDRYTQLAVTLCGTNTLDEQTKYSIRLYCYGALGMTREWLFNDNITPSKTVIQMMFNSMPESLKAIYFQS
ncbi:TetR/AcrR family transcriptional regulator C-terminal domain-containing protein [Clostridium sp. KNHs205]|uniref:TetR/AcrR family transcriptional regulator C-terminal domain-containing protein n=1 Tax=Clostridium sp. KNHs205 TaxID=1449050 RepID=UPI00051C4AEF|nr:TetR/AcrR family transcriptional regulator C-terminal domain-containing protein [Clostridium sp. KNHs205]